jgi:hypothetical protein
MLRTVRALAASLALALGAAVGVAPAASPVAANAGPPPDCRLDDVLTIPRGYDDWQHTLVDWILSVGPDYKPPDLVSISAAGVTGGGQIRQVAFDDLKAMAAAARDAGTPLGNVSSYRSYKTQKALFNSYVNGYGFKRAITFSARPGHSEHQLGLVIDFAPGGKSVFVNEETGAGAWLAKNAWKYGWLMSYPRGKMALTCYSYEPWHYRYFGRELAKEIHDSGLTTREYLWSHFTQVDPDTGEAVPSGSPAPSSPAATQEPGDSQPPPASPSPGETALAAPTSPSTGAPSTPVAAAGTWFGLDPPLVVAGALLVVAVVALLGALNRARRPRGR